VDCRVASSVGVKFVIGLRGLVGGWKRSWWVVVGGIRTSDFRLGGRRRLGGVVCCEAGTSVVGWPASGWLTTECSCTVSCTV
jgi:hypothetical protein